MPACGTPVTAAALQPSPQGAGSLAPPVPAALRAGSSPLPCCIFSGLFGCRTPSGPLPFHLTPAVTSAGGSSLLAVGWSRLRPASGCAHPRCRQGGPMRGVPHRKRLTLTTFRGGASCSFSPCERTYPALIRLFGCFRTCIVLNSFAVPTLVAVLQLKRLSLLNWVCTEYGMFSGLSTANFCFKERSCFFLGFLRNGGETCIISFFPNEVCLHLQ